MKIWRRHDSSFNALLLVLSFLRCRSLLISNICTYTDPEINVSRWKRFSATSPKYCTNPAVAGYSLEERERYKFGLAKYAYNVVVSDRMGPVRTITDTRHRLCRQITYEVATLPSASILLIYHNEALSVLIRMIESILSRTPERLIHEIILLDDCSDADATIEPQLKSYGQAFGWPMVKLRFSRNNERQGLIRSKIIVSSMATGEVIVFLDSHCEVNVQWLEPLLARIKENNTRVVLPVIDYIHPQNFAYEELLVGRVGFKWNLMFSWEYPPTAYYNQKEQRRIMPLRSPAMSGGLLAVNRDYFHKMGAYDGGMDIWGAENIEMSLRIWMCGGSVEVIPCSRVGHVFRLKRPYSNPNNTDHNGINSLRTALVWLDEYNWP